MGPLITLRKIQGNRTAVVSLTSLTNLNEGLGESGVKQRGKTDCRRSLRKCEGILTGLFIIPPAPPGAVYRSCLGLSCTQLSAQEKGRTSERESAAQFEANRQPTLCFSVWPTFPSHPPPPVSPDRHPSRSPGIPRISQSPSCSSQISHRPSPKGNEL